jgi:hypothetical protein
MKSGQPEIARGFWTAHFSRLGTGRKLLRLTFFILAFPCILQALLNLTFFAACGACHKSRATFVGIGIPLVLSVFAWRGIWQHRNDEVEPFPEGFALVFSNLALLIAIAASIYIRFLGDLTLQQQRFWLSSMTLLSLIGSVLGLIALRAPRWFSILALGAANWTFLLSSVLKFSV